MSLRALLFVSYVGRTSSVPASVHMSVWISVYLLAYSECFLDSLELLQCFE